MNTSGDGFGGHLRGYFGWVWVETFLISLFLFLMLFLFINREMMFAVVAVAAHHPIPRHPCRLAHKPKLR